MALILHTHILLFFVLFIWYELHTLAYALHPQHQWTYRNCGHRMRKTSSVGGLQLHSSDGCFSIQIAF